MEVGDEAEQQEIESPGDLDLRWLHRGGVHAGVDSPIPAALRALGLPRGHGRAWGGGESTVMAKVRRHLRERRGLRPDAMSILGYWKYREAASS